MIGFDISNFQNHGFAIGVTFAEHRIGIVEMRDASQAEKELRTGRIGIIRARHRQNSGFVWQIVELGINGISWSPGAGSFRASYLDHEIGNHTVEDNVIVKPNLGQTDNVAAMSGRHIGIQVHTDRTFGGFEDYLIIEFVEVNISQSGINICAAVFGHGTFPSMNRKSSVRDLISQSKTLLVTLTEHNENHKAEFAYKL